MCVCVREDLHVPTRLGERLKGAGAGGHVARRTYGGALPGRRDAREMGTCPAAGAEPAASAGIGERLSTAAEAAGVRRESSATAAVSHEVKIIIAGRNIPNFCGSFLAVETD